MTATVYTDLFMGDYSYQLEMAGLTWKFETPYEVELSENCVPFLIHGDKSDVHVRFQKGFFKSEKENLIRDRNPRVWHGEDYYRIERCLATSFKSRSSLVIPDEHNFRAHGYIYPGAEERVSTLEKIIDLSELEIFLASAGAVSLHSALIRYHGSAILFTAPSGTGKTTQAELWEQYRGAEQINGDRSIIRQIKGQWFAYGSPFAGTSGIFRNEKVLIDAIVVLRKSESDRIETITKAEAFRLLYSETTVPQWHRQAHLEVVDILTRIVAELPVFVLYCTPTEDAVNLLDDYLQGDGK